MERALRRSGGFLRFSICGLRLRRVFFTKFVRVCPAADSGDGRLDFTQVLDSRGEMNAPVQAVENRLCHALHPDVQRVTSRRHVMEIE